MTTHPTHWDSPPDYTSEAGDSVSPPQGNHYHRGPHPRGLSVSEPRYVYYRLYALDGMLHCKNSQQTPFIGRIKATSVPPPYTIASLKRALVQAEGLPDPEGQLTCLFETRDARTAMVMSARADIITGNLGATAQTPVVLVFLRSPKEPLQAASGDGVEDGGGKLPPVYYRLYNRGGEEKSWCSFDASEPALGRVNRESIAPPRNALSLKRRIARAEGKPIYEFADLFIDIAAVTAHPSNALVDDMFGSSKENPILLVQPERRPGLNRPALVVVLPPEVIGNACWLSVKPGDIVHTDGEARLEKHLNGGTISAYTAVDESGRTGLISANRAHSKLLDEPTSTWGCNIQ
ncbi:hypothetical protein B0H14DRAFT_2998333 [Mycena olivaceomarginata]|nr:hypothetical protein B0H14DRAFT_2998333 [Mycena olivaceomarginata]